ncbi:MAG: S41 family peptidase [bacterium]|nr:S41 family peptidase [bacterium]
MFKRKLVILFTVLLMVAGSLSVVAAEKAPTLDAKKRKAIINSVGKAMTEHYVFADIGKKMETHLHKQLKKGAYKKITDPVDLAQKLTDDLRDICHDKHLRVRFQPEPPRRREGAPVDHGAIQKRIDYNNAAFQKVERLTGNVGYLKLDGFIPAEYGGETAVAALNFLAGTDALIIDLRENGGGAPSMIQLISSYFFEESVHLNSFYIRKGEKTKQFWTQANVRGKRMTGVDIYVLTSKWTFSAAEEFTYNPVVS